MNKPNTVQITDQNAWLDYNTGKVGIHLLIEWQRQQHEILHEDGKCLLDGRRTLFWDSFGIALLYSIFDPKSRKQDGMGKFVYWNRVKRLVEGSKAYFTLEFEDEAVIECMYNISTTGAEKAIEHLVNELINAACLDRISALIQKFDYAVMINFFEHEKFLDEKSKIKLLKKLSSTNRTHHVKPKVTANELEQLTPKQRLLLLEKRKISFTGNQENVKQLLFPLIKSEQAKIDKILKWY
jgi:hypothetical protein